MTQKTVHVVDDDEAVLETIANMLFRPDIIVRPYRSARQFLSGFGGATDHTCLVTDVRMPDMDGIELVREVKAKHPRLPIVVMSGYADIPLVVEAMKLGATTFLQKPFKREPLTSAVEEAIGTGRPAQLSADPKEIADSQAKLASLTARQRDVLRGIVDGKLSKVIAYELGLSVRTVEGYRADIMKRTEVGSLSELVRMAVLADMAV